MFNQVISGQSLPVRLSFDHDLLFQFQKGWTATRQTTKPATPAWSGPDLSATLGEAIAKGCLNCPLPLECEFARHRISQALGGGCIRNLVATTPQMPRGRRAFAELIGNPPAGEVEQPIPEGSEGRIGFEIFDVFRHGHDRFLHHPELQVSQESRYGTEDFRKISEKAAFFCVY